jgi:formiminotetrahydrofolate cyclodeaminase
MTKKLVTVEAESIRYDLDGRTIKEAIKRLKDLAKTYSEDAVIDIGQECEAYSYSDKEYAYVRLNITRLENDEEYAKRLTQEAEYAAQQAKRDRESYERLKKQFG